MLVGDRDADPASRTYLTVMDDAPFGRLPRELRDDIYKLVVEDTPARLSLRRTRTGTGDSRPHLVEGIPYLCEESTANNATVLARVCRQLRDESLNDSVRASHPRSIQIKVQLFATKLHPNEPILRKAESIYIHEEWYKLFENWMSGSGIVQVTTVPSIEVQLGQLDYEKCNMSSTYLPEVGRTVYSVLCFCERHQVPFFLTVDTVHETFSSPLNIRFTSMINQTFRQSMKLVIETEKRKVSVAKRERRLTIREYMGCTAELDRILRAMTAMFDVNCLLRD